MVSWERKSPTSNREIYPKYHKKRDNKAGHVWYYKRIVDSMDPVKVPLEISLIKKSIESADLMQLLYNSEDPFEYNPSQDNILLEPKDMFKSTPIYLINKEDGEQEEACLNPTSVIGKIIVSIQTIWEIPSYYKLQR